MGTAGHFGRIMLTGWVNKFNQLVLVVVKPAARG